MTEKAHERLSDQLLEARVRRATLLNRQRDAFEAHRARERRRRTAKSAAKQWVRRKTESISLATGKNAGGPMRSTVPAAAGRSSAPPAVAGRGVVQMGGAGAGDGDGSDGDDEDIGQSFVRHVSRLSSATAASIGGLGESVSAFGSFAFGDAFATEVRCLFVCLFVYVPLPVSLARRAAARRSRDPPERSAHSTPPCPPCPPFTPPPSPAAVRGSVRRAPEQSAHAAGPSASAIRGKPSRACRATDCCAPPNCCALTFSPPAPLLAIASRPALRCACAPSHGWTRRRLGGFTRASS